VSGSGHHGRRLRSPRATAALAFALLIPLPAAALDPFEIQVYDGTANAAGVAGLELHLNYVPKGLAYVQGALLPDGTFGYAGVKLRSKFVTPPGWREHLRLGVNLEVSHLPSSFDPSRWGAEVRPIVAWEDDRFILAVNGNLGFALAAPDAWEGPELEPCAMAKVKVAGFAIGLEYYASLGSLGSFLPLAQQEHDQFETIDVLSLRGVELDAAVGEGLTSASNPLVVKIILGYSFGR